MPRSRQPRADSQPDDRAEGDLAPRRSRPLWHWAALIFVVAFGLRLIYLGTIGDIAYFNRPVSDGLVYDQRAQKIAAGDLVGPPDFVHAPLYAYVLGAIEWVVGHNLWAVRFVQMLLGGAACVVLMLACRRLFYLEAGIVAGLLLAVYPPALFFDGLIQKTSLDLLLTVSLLWLVAACASRPRWATWLGVGLVLGLSVLTRQNALAIVLLFLAWLWIEFRKRPLGARLGWTAAWAVGLIVTLLPWAARNRAVTGDFVLTTPNLGQNFYMGNHAGATGTYVPLKTGWGTAELEQQAWERAARRETGRSMTAVETSDYYLDKALDYIRANPGDWLRLLIKKTLMVWNAYEVHDTEDYYLYGEWSGLLGALDRAWHFGLLCPLAAAGIVLTWPRRRELWFLHAWLVVTTAGVAVFVVFARYRFPLVPVLMMFAGTAAVQGAALVRRRAWRHLRAPGVALVITAAAANWLVFAPRQPSRMGYNNHCIILQELDRFQEALDEANRGLARYPGEPLLLVSAGTALSQMNRLDEAIRTLEQARSAAPDMAETYRCLANALKSAGQLEAAAAQYQTGLRLDPEDFRGLNGLAAVLAELGRPREAVELIQRSLGIQPGYARGYLNLGNVYLLLKRPDEAVAAYRQALELDPDFVDALFNIGVVELQRGRPADAVAPLREAVAKDPERREAKLALATALIDSGGLEDAPAVLLPMLGAAMEEPAATVVVGDEGIVKHIGRLLSIAARLAWIQATSPDPAIRDGAAAVALAARVCERTGNKAPTYLRVYAAALAETGQFDQAVAGATLAIQLAEQAGLAELAAQVREELTAYEAHQPFRDTRPRHSAATSKPSE